MAFVTDKSELKPGLVIFRRGDDWRLLATMVNVQGALYAAQPCPRGEIWLSDSDVVNTRMRWMIIIVTVMSAIFGVAITGFGLRK